MSDLQTALASFPALVSLTLQTFKYVCSRHIHIEALKWRMCKAFSSKLAIDPCLCLLSGIGSNAALIDAIVMWKVHSGPKLPSLINTFSAGQHHVL